MKLPFKCASGDPHRNLVLAILALVWALSVAGDRAPHTPSRLDGLPGKTLWAWERREDLRTIEVKKFAVGYLDRTITIGATVEVQPRLNPVLFPASAVRVPVVRLEAPVRRAVLSDANRRAAVEAILASAREPGAALLQVDFDATSSQQPFYRSLLVDLRRLMPPQLPLSITALASWCSWDRWMEGLPIDEAVPMMFQMEPDRRRAAPDADDFRIREPLCRGAVGVSLGERWPRDVVGKRVYIFAEDGWRGQPEKWLKEREP